MQKICACSVIDFILAVEYDELTEPVSDCFFDKGDNVMNCKQCGAELEQDSRFCFSCGARMDEAPDMPVGTPDMSMNNERPVFPSSVPAPKAKTDWRNLLTGNAKMIRLIVGTLLIILGLIRVFMAGTSISSTSFGADFYTYTYQGIVAVSEILASIEASLGWVIVAIGAAIDVGALRD